MAQKTVYVLFEDFGDDDGNPNPEVMHIVDNEETAVRWNHSQRSSIRYYVDKEVTSDFS